MYKLFGILASISIVVSYIPQIKQTFTTKDVSGQNVNFWLLLTFSVSYFFIDAILKQVGLVTILAQLCNLAGAGSMLFMVYTYQDKRISANSKEIKIKYFSEDYPRLEKLEQGDWIDLRVDTLLKHNGVKIEDLSRNDIKTISYDEGDILFLGLGVAMELPDGYEAHILPRSSMFDNSGFLLTNKKGIIDNSYCGDKDEWKAMVYCTRDGEINRHDRLFQFRIVKKQPNIVFKVVQKLSGENRGGFGSSGLK